MARVPTIQRGTVKPTEGARIRQSPAQTTAQINARPIENAAQGIRGIIDKEAAEFHKAAMDEFSVEASKLRNNVMNEVQKLRGKNAAGAQEFAESAWSEGMDNLRKQHIFTPQQARDADAMNAKWLSGVQNKVNTYASGELQRYKVKTAGDALDDLAAQAGQLHGDAEFAENLKDVNRQAEYLSELIGADPEDAKSKALAGSIGSYVQTQLDRGDPIAAAEIYNKYSEQLQGTEAAKLEKTFGRAIREKGMDIVAQRIAHGQFTENLADGADGGKTQKQIVAEIMGNDKLNPELKERAIDALQGIIQQQKRAQSETDKAVLNDALKSPLGQNGSFVKWMRNNPDKVDQMSGQAQDKLRRSDFNHQIRQQIRRQQASTRAAQRLAAKNLDNKISYMDKNNLFPLRLKLEQMSSQSPAGDFTDATEIISSIEDPAVRADFQRQLEGAINRKGSSGAKKSSRKIASMVKESLAPVDFRNKSDKITDARDVLISEDDISDDKQRARLDNQAWKTIDDSAKDEVSRRIEEELAQKPDLLDNLSPRDRKELVSGYYSDAVEALRRERVPGIPEWQFRVMGVEELSKATVDHDSVKNTQAFGVMRRALKALGGKEFIKDEESLSNLYGTFLMGLTPQDVAAMNGGEAPDGVTPLNYSTTMLPFRAALAEKLPGITPKMITEFVVEQAGGPEISRETADALIRARRTEAQAEQKDRANRESLNRFRAL